MVSLIIVQQLNNKSMVAHKFCELLLVNVCVPLDCRLPVFSLFSFPSFFLMTLHFVKRRDMCRREERERERKRGERNSILQGGDE